MNVLDQKKEMCLSFDTPPYLLGQVFGRSAIFVKHFAYSRFRADDRCDR